MGVYDACGYIDLGIKTGDLVLAAPKAKVPYFQEVLDSGCGLRMFRTASKYIENFDDFAEQTGLPLWLYPSDSVECDVKNGQAELLFDFKDTGQTLEKNGFGVVRSWQPMWLNMIVKPEIWELYSAQQSSYEQMDRGRFIGEGWGAPELKVLKSE